MRSKLVVGKNGKRLGTRIPRNVEDFKKDFPKFHIQKKMGYKTPCWIWGLKKEAKTYATTRLNGIPIPSNRLSWIIHFGEIPKGLWVLHKCDVRACVNPEHLFLGTRLDNIRDMVSKGRQKNMAGELSPRSILTKKQVLKIRRLAYESKMTYPEIAAMFNVSSSCINSVVSRSSWRDCGGLNRRSRINQKLKSGDCKKIKDEYRLGKNQKEIADLFNVSQSVISRIVTGSKIPICSK